jgi:hypothetical protein
MVITWISWGAAPGYINIAPLGLKQVIFISQKVQFVPVLSINFASSDAISLFTHPGPFQEGRKTEKSPLFSEDLWVCF